LPLFVATAYALSIALSLVAGLTGGQGSRPLDYLSDHISADNLVI
jgi:hypothetical protein